MDAELVLRQKSLEPDGFIAETVIWKLPTPVAGSAHLYKYRLFYGRDGRRVVGFDNERGKGDHMHMGELELPYVFVSVPDFMNDFFAAIERSQTNENRTY
jgi:hypothetical protein